MSDGDADHARARRRDFLDRQVETDTLVLTAHFPSPSVGHVAAKGDAFRFDFL